jgi:hypothetical protein
MCGVSTNWPGRDPRRAFVTHRHELHGVAAHRHHGHQPVATDAAHCARAFRNLRAGVVRAAGAEIRRSHRRAAERERALFQAGECGVAFGKDRVGDAELLQQRPDRAAHHAGREFACRRQQRRAREVLLAGQRWAFIGRERIQLPRDLVLHHWPLFLDHQQRAAAAREAREAHRVHRPDQPRLVEADAEPAAAILVQAQVGQRLPHVQAGLAGADDGQLAALAVDHDAVDTVGAREGGGGRQPVVDQPVLLHQRRQVRAQVEPLGRQPDVGGRDEGTMRIGQLHAGRQVQRVGDAFQPDIAAAVARHGPAEQAELDDLAYGGGVEDRQHGRDQRVLGLVRAVGRLAAVIVAGHGQEAAVRGGALEIAELQRFAGAIDADALAVPQAEDALELRLAEPRQLLGAANRADRELLVQTRPEHDVVLVQQFLRAPQRGVVDPQRRAAIARDVTGGLQSGGAVASRLVERQAHQGLVRRDEDASARLQVLVVERGHGACHRRRPRAASGEPAAGCAAGSRSSPPSAGSRSGCPRDRGRRSSSRGRHLSAPAGRRSCRGPSGARTRARCP